MTKRNFTSQKKTANAIFFGVNSSCHYSCFCCIHSTEGMSCKKEMIENNFRREIDERANLILGKSNLHTRLTGSVVTGQSTLSCCQYAALGFLNGIRVHSFCCLFHPQYGSMAPRHCLSLLNLEHLSVEMRTTDSSVAKYRELVSSRNLRLWITGLPDARDWKGCRISTRQVEPENLTTNSTFKSTVRSYKFFLSKI